MVFLITERNLSKKSNNTDLVRFLLLKVVEILKNQNILRCLCTEIFFVEKISFIAKNLCFKTRFFYKAFVFQHLREAFLEESNDTSFIKI